jgi:hypothetical protein
MASETTAANPELLQEPVAILLVQPLEAASVVLSSTSAKSPWCRPTGPA